jgi:hypothetical protein
MQRRVELDALRGLMLIWITFTHLPTALSTYTSQPFGFLSASEGFIFLSALFAGLIYCRLAQREGVRAMCRKAWMRTGRLYLYHALLLVLLFVVEARMAAQGNRPAIHNLLDFYFTAGAMRATIYAALLLYRPPLLDILPIYIVFLALTPLVLISASRWGWKLVLGGSFVLWMLAQFGFRGFVYGLIARGLGLQTPLQQMGPFDYWAWQFWWVLGIWLGVNWAENTDLSLSALARRFAIPAGAVALSLLVLRQAQIHGLVEFGKFAFLVDKWHLGVVRLIDFAAVALLAIFFQSWLKRLAVRPLVLMGQASLQVFCVHLAVVFFALTILGQDPVISGWRVPVLVTAGVAALLVTGKVFAKDKGTSGKGVSGQPSVRKLGELKRLPPQAGVGGIGI